MKIWVNIFIDRKGFIRATTSDEYPVKPGGVIPAPGRNCEYITTIPIERKFSFGRVTKIIEKNV